MSGNFPHELMDFDGDDGLLPPELIQHAPFNDALDVDDEEDESETSDNSAEYPLMANANDEHAFQAMDEVEPPLKIQNIALDYDVVDAKFDLDLYAAQYTSQALVQRLFFVAEHSSVMKHDALFMLIKYVKEHTYDTALYQKCMTRLVGDGSAPDLDKIWIDATLKKGTAKREKLEMDLKHYRNNSIHDSIRRGLEEYAEHCLEMGDMQEALKNFSRTRDYCSGPQNTLQMNLNVIRVSVYMCNWTLVQSYVQRAKTCLEQSRTSGSVSGRKTTTNKETQTFMDVATSQLHASTGLVELANGKYEQAVQSFLNVKYAHLQYGSVMSEREVGVYTAMCALASYDRNRLADKLINNVEFKQFLELEPRVLSALRFFNVGDYNKCLAVLDAVRPNLLLDVHLAKHVDHLYAMIRQRGMIAYVSPYSCADLKVMAVAFNCASVEVLEDELVPLILDRHIRAMIDSEAKTLHSYKIDQRRHAYNKAIDAAHQMQRNANLVALRQAAICVQSEGKTQNKKGANKKSRSRTRTTKRSKPPTTIAPQSDMAGPSVVVVDPVAPGPAPQASPSVDAGIEMGEEVQFEETPIIVEGLHPSTSNL